MPYNEYQQHDNRCYFCKQPIPKYELGGAVYAHGFVPPSPSRRNTDDLTAEEIPHVKFKQGPTGMTATAVEERACRECYLKEFMRLHPGAKPPRMPRLLDSDDDVAGLMDASAPGVGVSTVADVEEFAARRAAK